MMTQRIAATKAAAGAFAVALTLAISPHAAAAFTNPNTIPATGTFTFTTAPGIVPAWERESIVLTAVTPASVTDLTVTATSRLTMPVVAKTGSANALSGGFRLTNTKTRESIRCLIPTLDTKARILDCVLDNAENGKIFTIETIGSRVSTTQDGLRTTEFTGMQFKVASSEVASTLNTKLSTTVFTTSVVIATGELEVSWVRQSR